MRGFLGVVLFVLIFFPILTFAQGVPPGLENAPPCNGLDMPNQARVPCSGILQFAQGITSEQRANSVQKAGAHLRFNYKMVNAAAVVVPNSDSMAALLEDGNIVAVIPDRPVKGYAKPDVPPGKDKGTNDGGSTGSNQIIPEGVKRIGALNLSVDGSGVGVAIVDTGKPNHSDLNVAPECFTAYSSCNDVDGHATHVSGIVAANDNDQDVIGVAPGATIYGVKVLGDTGSGTDSSIIAGMEWIANNYDKVSPHIVVANVSLGRLGTLGDNPVMEEAFRVVAEDLGIPIIVAAGNDPSYEVEDNVPATYPEVIAIASTTAKNGRTSKCRYLPSNYSYPADSASFYTTDGAFNDLTGIGVSVSAPGDDEEYFGRSCYASTVGILSLNVSGGTTRMSGTSMATPHVTGVVALIIDKALNGGGPVPDSEAIRDILRSTAFGVGVYPLNGITTSYTFDGEREGVVSACQALGESC